MQISRKILFFDMFNASLMNFLFPRKSLCTRVNEYNEYKLENNTLLSVISSVQSVGPDPLRLPGPGGDLGRLHGVRVVSVVVSTLRHLTSNMGQ